MEFVELLKKWNSDLLKDEGVEDFVDSAYLKAKWLGMPAASETDIAIAESRLGADFPQSYRQFLLIANGWIYPGNDMDFPGPLRPIERVCWLREEDAEWIDAWVNAGHTDVSDDDYFVYGEEQDPVTLRVDYLKSCLKISDVTEGGVYLLNPDVKGKDGEWEAWHFSNELPGATRCRTFRDLIKQQRALFRSYRE